MATYTLSISSGTFGFIVGGISLLSLVINVCRYHLPSKKIKVLESLLEETDTFFKKAVEDGLLHEQNFVEETEKHLTMLKERLHNLQSRAYSATTLGRDYAEFLRGTSTSIGRACQSLKKIRAEVITSSEEGRRRLMEMNSALRVPLPTLPQNSETQAVNRPILPPAAEITRPRSCPPPLRVWSMDDTRTIASSDNPFNDVTQTGSDAQSTDVEFSITADYTSANVELEA